MELEEKDTPIGPAIPDQGDDEKSITEKCTEDRGSLTPHETADCAGASVTELYENEEDGGT